MSNVITTDNTGTNKCTSINLLTHQRDIRSAYFNLCFVFMRRRRIDTSPLPPHTCRVHFEVVSDATEPREVYTEVQVDSFKRYDPNKCPRKKKVDISLCGNVT